MFPLDQSYLRPNLGDANRLYWAYASAYQRKVLSYSPIAYWPLNERSGLAAKDVSGNDLHGTYTGVTLGQTGIGDGDKCPLFDGANDYVDVYSAGLNTAFSGAAGTIALWAKVFNSGVWSDEAYRYAMGLGVDNNNYVRIGKNNDVGGTSIWIYEANNVTEADYSDLGDPTVWMHMAMTWTKAGADEVEYFHDGVSLATDATLGVWAGALSATKCTIGAQDKTPTNPWYGYIAHPAVFTSVLTQPELADLATV